MNSERRPGWATTTLASALRRATLAGGLVLTLPTLLLLIVRGGETGGRWFAAAACAVALLAIAASLRVPALPASAFLPSWYLAILLCWAAAGSPSSVPAMSAAWLGNLAPVAAGLLVRRLGPVVLCGLLGLAEAATIALAHPAWGSDLVVSRSVTPLAIALVAYRGRLYLEQFARRADERSERAARTQREAWVVRAAVTEAADISRRLHDTAINTLGAVAAGGRAVRDAERVRRRCARDAATLAELAGETRGRDLPDAALDLPRLADAVGLTLRRTGWDDDHLAAWARETPGEVVSVIGGAIAEALVNASKHTSVDHVLLTIEGHGGSLSVTIADSGGGFPPGALPGRGLRGSILDPCAAVGVAAGYENRPGIGVSVTLHYTPADDPDTGFDEVVETTTRRAYWAWPVGVAVIGVFIELLNEQTLWTWTGVMLAVAGAVALLARWWARRGPIGVAPTLLMTAAVPVVLVLSLAELDFGRGELIWWQSLAPTAPVVLLYLSRLRWAVPAGVVLLVGGTVALWADAERAGAENAGSLLVGSSAACAILLGMAIFRRAVLDVGRRSAAEHDEAQRARTDAAVRAAAEPARRRWKLAGLETSRALLTGIAEGELDPAEPHVRELAALEEQHLRQLLVLSPELVHLGPWLAWSSALARERGVHLALRTGEDDAPDAAGAAVAGQVVVRAVGAAPPGQQLVVGLFRRPQRTVLTLVAPELPGDVTTGMGALPEGWLLEADTQLGQTIVELSWPRSEPVAVATRGERARSRTA